MMKTDFGLMLIFLMTSYIFNYKNYAFLIFDSAMAIVLLVNIYIMRSSVSIFNFLYFKKI